MILLQHLKTLLEECKSYWVDELLGALWACRITPRSSTGETLFCLVYRSEAMIFVEIREATIRVRRYEKSINDEATSFNFEMIEEKRKATQVQMLKAKNRMINNYNKKVKNDSFQVGGDLVLKKVEVSNHVDKLDPNWESPFKIMKICKRGTYRLQDMHNKDLP